MSALPKWADNKLGRELVSAIVKERPDFRLRPYEGSNIGGEAVYRGTVAARLRRMHREWLERSLARMDATFKITGVWDDAASKRLLREINADQLIERLLTEPAERRAA